MNKKLFGLMFMFLFAITLVSAVPPVQSTVIAIEGIEIESANFDYLKANTSHIFRFRAYNASNNVFLNDAMVNCSMGIVDNYGNYLFQQPNVVSTGYQFNVSVSAGNFTEEGIYHKGINCIMDDGTAGGVLTQSFEITTTGKAPIDNFLLAFFILLFLVIAVGTMIITLRYFQRGVNLEMDLSDLVMSFISFFVFLMFYYFAFYYWGNPFVMDLLGTSLWVVGFMNLFVASIMVIFNLIKRIGDKA